jgi:tetratricopeptide (TPR) repeat protein
LVDAQTRQECEAGDCRGVADDLADAATRIRQARTDFVAALRRFWEALPGTHGDEGPELRRALDAMSESLGRWDRAIRAYQMPLSGVAGNADVHVALGTIHFERGRPRLATTEWSEASRLAPDRLDVFLLRGLAYDAEGRHADSVKAFERASRLAPANPAALYALAQQHRRLGDQQRATDVLGTFTQRVVLPSTTVRGQPPFLRGGLIREAAGVAPIFAPALYAAGFDALARGAYDDALAAFERALMRDPLTAATSGAVGAALADGRAALRAGDLGKALKFLESAVQAAPELQEARRLLGAALAAAERPVEAIEQLRAAVKLDRLDERSRLALARELTVAGRPLDAEALLRDTVAALPASAEAHFELGRLYQSLERRREAAEAFAAAAAFKPLVGLERLYDLIGLLRLAEADFDGAIEALWRRIDASPNHVDAHRSLGETYLQLGRHDEAQAELMAAILIDPADAGAHAARAQAYLRTGRYDAAVASARAALARDANHMGALYALGTGLVRLGQAPEGTAAIERFQALQTAARARDERAWTLRLLTQTAWANAEQGQFDEAIARLREAVAIEPSADAFLSLGVVLKRAGRPQEALEALERAAALQDGSQVHAQLAEVYATLGRPDDSQRHRALHERAKEERFRGGGGR